MLFRSGGGVLAASLLDQGLVDQIVGFTAGVVLGGDGLPAVASMQLARLADAPRFALAETRQVGADLFHRWRRILSTAG